MHVLLIVKDSYHDVKLYIPGPYNIKNGKLLKTVSGFEKWLYNYIEQNNLSENIVFTGKLNIEEMAYYYEKCNIFVSPSCMEVHSGSLREALCVGIPSISSLCGCVGDLIKHGVNGYIYRYEEEEILAFYINKLFANELLAKSFSLLSKECIQKYDYNEKFETLERIYHFINEK
ncbi:hypothetical protein SDC9_142734 [bioreactor metagenome]|uniref:Glycosyl transferase family 1 domain-containing protein n=1 Tax=bioreactor metagenome TaxID=1076179 RepID=A0A645E200_9ZZZZ